MDYGKIKFLHVTRLDDVADILACQWPKYVFPKLDGTNGTVWADEDGTVHAGSRNRELTIEDDNAGFCKHVLESDVMEPVRLFCVDHPDFFVCGEWLGGKAGHIKQYLNREFYIFDVHRKAESTDEAGRNAGYVRYCEYEKWFSDYGYEFVVPPLAFVESNEALTLQEVFEIAENNHYNLPESIVGEGVVVKSYEYVDRWGNYQEGKLVRDEYKADKGKKKTLVEACSGNVETAIADDYVTASDVEKCKNKVSDLLGKPFDLKDGKCIGMVIEMAYRDVLEEEILAIAKKYGKYPITLKVLKSAVTTKVKGFIGIK